MGFPIHFKWHPHSHAGAWERWKALKKMQITQKARKCQFLARKCKHSIESYDKRNIVTT